MMYVVPRVWRGLRQVQESSRVPSAEWIVAARPRGVPGGGGDGGGRRGRDLREGIDRPGVRARLRKGADEPQRAPRGAAEGGLARLGGGDGGAVGELRRLARGERGGQVLRRGPEGLGLILGQPHI